VLSEKETDLFSEAKEFSEFCAGGGMEQLSGGTKTAIEDKSADETSNLY
jgi:hypothetical protein